MWGTLEGRKARDRGKKERKLGLKGEIGVQMVNKETFKQEIKDLGKMWRLNQYSLKSVKSRETQE